MSSFQSWYYKRPQTIVITYQKIEHFVNDLGAIK